MVMRKFLSLLPLLVAGSAAVDISVASSGGNSTGNNLQYGIMEEEINHCGDGGLYAELIRNRAFQGDEQFPPSLEAWSPVSDASLSLKQLSNPLSSALPLSVRVKGGSGGHGPKKGEAGLTNQGWWGMDVRRQKYTGSFYVKGSYNGVFKASLQSSTTGETLATTHIPSKCNEDEWVQHHFTLVPKKAAPNTKNTFSITFDSRHAEDGSLDFNLISLFPPTWNDRPNGMRRELMQAMQDMGPKFLRFPGGNNLEGTTIPGRWKWNETIGPLKDRPGRGTPWSYHETSGLGLVEYMEWCDDLDVEPVLGVWAGLALNGDIVPESELGPYVQDALDELEFLLGPADSKFGALRAKYGHPEPWKINFVEVGNEDDLNGGLPSYKAYRFPMFYNAIKNKYPHMQVLTSTINMELPGDAGGDYHLYDIPDNFVRRFGFFDQYSDAHPIILGEIASVAFNNGEGITWGETEFSLYPWWIGTVAEAVFMVGAERNADKIIGSTYAPFMMNMDGYQWSPTNLAFNADPSDTARSTSWHVYELFSHTHMTHTLPAKSSAGFDPLYYVAGRNDDSGSHIFKAAVYNSTEEVPVSVSFEGVDAGTKAELTVLTAPDAYSMNEIGGGNIVQRQVSTVTAGKGREFSFELPDLSVAVLRAGA